MMEYYDDNTGEQLNLLRSWLKFNEESFRHIYDGVMSDDKWKYADSFASNYRLKRE